MIKRVPLLLWPIISKPAKKKFEKILLKSQLFFEFIRKVLKLMLIIYAVSTLDLFIHEKFKD